MVGVAVLVDDGDQRDDLGLDQGLLGENLRHHLPAVVRHHVPGDTSHHAGLRLRSHQADGTPGSILVDQSGTVKLGEAGRKYRQH